MYTNQNSTHWEEMSRHAVPVLQPVYEEGFPKMPPKRGKYDRIDPIQIYDLVLFTGDRCKAIVRESAESPGRLEWMAMTDTDFSRAGQTLNPMAVAAWSQDR